VEAPEAVPDGAPSHVNWPEQGQGQGQEKGQGQGQGQGQGPGQGLEHALAHSHAHCGHSHFSHRAPWLRAALLGAQDGVVSVASLMVGVSAVQGDRSSMVVSGLAGQPSGPLIRHCTLLLI